MRRKWIVGVATLAAIGITAATATSVFGGGAAPRPEVASVNLELEPAAKARAQAAKKAKKPKILYLLAQPATVNTSPPPTGLGPNIDIGLGPCPGKSKVVEGGVIPGDLSADVQGSFIEGDDTYHVLLEDETLDSTSFQVEGHLTCIKGVK